MKLSIPLCMNGRGCYFPAARLGCYPQSHGGTLLDHNMETKSQRENGAGNTLLGAQHSTDPSSPMLLSLLALTKVVHLELD